MAYLNQKLGEGLFGVFLGASFFYGLTIYRPNYRAVYCWANVKRL